jgi:hypothetical protein
MGGVQIYSISAGKNFVMKSLIMPCIILHLLVNSNCNNKTGKGGEKLTILDSIPVCLKQKIEAFSRADAYNPPIKVDEYQYRGKRVFLFTADCCDQFDMLYDDSCQVLCASSGGFTGKGDGKCADFSTTAKHLKLIWKKAGQ